MWIVVLIAVLAVVLLQASGVIPDSSVGGPMTLTLIFLVAALALGAYEAFAKRRGVVGWFGSLIIAFIGGLIGAAAGGMILESAIMLGLPRLEGTSLVASGGPWLYLGLAAQMLFTLLGSWLALALAGRWR